MPCPHNEISIVQRSHRQSAVAAAAYQSGEKLFCEYDQEVKHYPEKRGIVHNEILLPANAPLEYTDRNTLWNAAEAVEKQWNSQLARRWVLSIPREIPPDQYAALVRDFCRQQFVSKGMCVDFAIHDKGDGNPHAHVMLTISRLPVRTIWQSIRTSLWEEFRMSLSPPWRSFAPGFANAGIWLHVPSRKMMCGSSTRCTTSCSGCRTAALCR